MPLGRAVCLNARSFSLELLSLAVCPEDSIRPSAILCCHLWLPPALLGRSSQFPHPTSVAMSTKLRPTPSSCTLVYVGLNLAALKSMLDSDHHGPVQQEMKRKTFPTNKHALLDLYVEGRETLWLGQEESPIQ